MNKQLLQRSEMPPAEIIAAAEKLHRYFDDINIERWELGNCQSRSATSDSAGWQPTTAALTALKQFSQDCPHNLPADTLYTLAAIGLLYKNRASHYSITDYGNSVLAAAMTAGGGQNG